MTVKTVVVTGASSGIGEATALALAKRGYNLVLASRNEAALHTVAAACQVSGARTLVVATDVSSMADMQRLADKSTTTFGTIDVWINNASVIFYGRFLDIEPAEFQQVIDTNLLGAVYGSREALLRFRAQKQGTLINISSGLGAIPAPYASAYVTSKFAVRGLTASLAQELYLDGEHSINACCVLPATINTPVYQHGGNRMEFKVRAMPPVYPVDKAVRKIIKLIDNPRPEVVVGNIIRPMAVLYALMPGWFPKLFARYVRRFSSAKEPNKPTPGNTFRPYHDGSPDGGWSNTSSKPKKEHV